MWRNSTRNCLIGVLLSVAVLYFACRERFELRVSYDSDYLDQWHGRVAELPTEFDATLVSDIRTRLNLSGQATTLEEFTRAHPDVREGHTAFRLFLLANGFQKGDCQDGLGQPLMIGYILHGPAIWSVGLNGLNEHGGGDDIVLKLGQ
jgi:hypothetical protein